MRALVRPACAIARVLLEKKPSSVAEAGTTLALILVRTGGFLMSMSKSLMPGLSELTPLTESTEVETPGPSMAKNSAWSQMGNAERAQHLQTRSLQSSSGIPAYGEQEEVGDSGASDHVSRDYDVNETSGLWADDVRGDTLWAHNDSGDGANLFAIDENTGQRTGKFTLDGVDADDWEDISGRGGDVYVADFGNNGHARGSDHVYKIHRVSGMEGGGEQRVSGDQISTYAFQYGDSKPHDAESMFVDPDSGDMYVVTKEHGEDKVSEVFRLGGEIAETSANPPRP